MSRNVIKPAGFNHIEAAERFAARQTIHKLMKTYSRAETEQKARLREVTVEQLPTQLCEERYLLDVTRMTLWSKAELYELSETLQHLLRRHIQGLHTAKQKGTVALAKWLALVIIKEKIPYELVSGFRIKLLPLKAV
jgi:hypothetical protein